VRPGVDDLGAATDESRSRRSFALAKAADACRRAFFVSIDERARSEPRAKGGVVAMIDHEQENHAKGNLREIEDDAVKYGFSEHQEARFPRVDLGMAATGVAYLRIKPGKREAFAHRHITAEEVVLVLSGTGRVKLDDQFVELAPLDLLRVSPGVTRAFEAADEGLEVVVFGAHVDGDAEIVQNFWDR
jgi:uncharacterized cupin superfamily protein